MEEKKMTYTLESFLQDMMTIRDFFFVSGTSYNRKTEKLFLILNNLNSGIYSEFCRNRNNYENIFSNLGKVADVPRGMNIANCTTQPCYSGIGNLTACIDRFNVLSDNINLALLDPHEEANKRILPDIFGKGISGMIRDTMPQGCKELLDTALEINSGAALLYHELLQLINEIAGNWKKVNLKGKG